jgi:hypothetical protein
MKTTLPLIPVGHPDYKWRSGADVQATWHRYTGWTPPSGSWVKPLQPIQSTPAFIK